MKFVSEVTRAAVPTAVDPVIPSPTSKGTNIGAALLVLHRPELLCVLVLLLHHTEKFGVLDGQVYKALVLQGWNLTLSVLLLYKMLIL